MIANSLVWAQAQANGYAQGAQAQAQAAQAQAQDCNWRKPRVISHEVENISNAVDF